MKPTSSDKEKLTLNSRPLSSTHRDLSTVTQKSNFPIFKQQISGLQRPQSHTIHKESSARSISRPQTSCSGVKKRSEMSNLDLSLPTTTKHTPGTFLPVITNRPAVFPEASEPISSRSKPNQQPSQPKSPLVINVFPTLPNRYTYESDDLTLYLNVLKTCKMPQYLISSQEADKRKNVYSSLAFIMSAFQYHDRMVFSNGEPDERTMQNISYGHPQDLFQICCFLLKESLSYCSEVDNLKYEMREKDKRIEEMCRKYESTNDHDLVKIDPNANDLKNLEESIVRLEDDIASQDPVLFKEMQEKKEDSELLSEMGSETKTQQTFVNTKEAVPPLPSLIRTAEISRKTSAKSTPRKEPPSEECLRKENIQKYDKALKYKMRLLENLIFVLKKKVKRFEQSDSDVKRMIVNWGSLPELLKDNERMKKELKFFDWVTQRFDTELLLKHKYLYTEDVYLMRSAIFALQNELFVAQRGLALYNNEQNKSLKILSNIKPEPMTAMHNTLEFIMTDLFMTEKQKNDFERKKEAKRTVAEQNHKVVPDDVDTEPSLLDLRNTLRSLEHENKFLKNQVSRLEQQVGELIQTLDLLKEDTSADRKIEIKERDSMIRKLTSRIDQLNKSATEKEVYFLFQQHLVRDVTQKREQLFEENSKNNDSLIKTRNELLSLQQKVKHQSEGMKIMYQIATSLLFHFMSDTGTSTSLSGQNLLKSIFRDVFSLHITRLNAIVKIQSWVKGIQTRIRLKQQEKYASLIERSTERKKEKGCPKPKKDEDPSKTQLPLFSAFSDYLKVASAFSNESSSIVAQSGSLIQCFKEEITTKFKGQILSELDSFRKYQQDMHIHLAKTINFVVLPSKNERACQTETTEYKSRGVQSGVTGLSVVELRK